jgi:hypothetical protein
MMLSIQNTYAILAQYLFSEDNNRPSDEVIELWMTEIVSMDQYTFSDGIIGLGWLVSFLIQNGYIAADVDEILENVDDNIYKFTIKTILEEQPDIDQMLGLVTFYQQRIANKESKASFYRNFSHFESLKLLLKKLNDFLLSHTITHQNLSINIGVILKYGYLIQSEVRDPLMEEVFYSKTEQLIVYFEALSSVTITNEILLDLLKFAAGIKQYHQPYWAEKINAVYLNMKKLQNQDDKVSPVVMIWEKIYLSIPKPDIRYKEDQDFWQTEDGMELLFFSYTNIISIKVSND